MLAKELSVIIDNVAKLPAEDKINESYNSFIKNSLQDILTTKDCFLKLLYFMDVNWQKVKATRLCYTANHPTTKILIKFAKLLEKHGAKPAINYLLPGISTQSLEPDTYQDLAPYQVGEKLVYPNITEILKTHIFGDGNYLIPIKILLANTKKIKNFYYDYTKYGQNFYLNNNEKATLFNNSPQTRALNDAIVRLKNLLAKKTVFSITLKCFAKSCF